MSALYFFFLFLFSTSTFKPHDAVLTALQKKLFHHECAGNRLGGCGVVSRTIVLKKNTKVIRVIMSSFMTFSLLGSKLIPPQFWSVQPVAPKAHLAPHIGVKMTKPDCILKNIDSAELLQTPTFIVIVTLFKCNFMG